MTLTEAQLDAYVARAISISESALIVDPAAPFVQVIEARDSRYTTLPVVEDETKIPDNDNLIQFNHRLKYADASDMARNLRPFMSRYGRVIDVPYAKSVHIADSGSNIIRLLAMIKVIDVAAYDEGKKEIEDLNEKHRKILKNEKSVGMIVLENQGVFFIVFLILGLILGFGVRGYLMKRVEGGW